MFERFCVFGVVVVVFVGDAGSVDDDVGGVNGTAGVGGICVDSGSVCGVAVVFVLVLVVLMVV